MKTDYNHQMLTIIKKEAQKRPKLLLHSCCAPCSSAVIERLSKDFAITVYYYNPNIEPFAEYQKRQTEQINYLIKLGIPYLDANYDNVQYQAQIKGLENEPEGKKRCFICFQFRLTKTALKAKEYNFDYFGTTLTISPHKNSQVINELGIKIATEQKINFLCADFKKEDGYKRSIELSKENNLYRQNYCGCEYSKTQR